MDADSLDIVRFVKLNDKEGIFAIVGVHDGARIPVHSIRWWRAGEVSVGEDGTIRIDRCNSCKKEIEYKWK